MIYKNRILKVIFPVLLVLIFTMLLVLCACLAAGGLIDFRTGSVQTDAAPEDAPVRRVVIDPGHGGEDSGALSAAGLEEKDVNLVVSLYLRDYLEAAGIPVVMTRTADKLLYDPQADFHGRKKQMDLNSRLHTAQAVPDSLLVSIHMNSFPQSQYKGMQVWYATGDPRSMEAASAVQSQAIQLDADNHRRIKAAGSNIFLLDRLDTPGILVEGGFLSNPAEAERLADAQYQKELAFVIFTGVMSYMK